MPCHEGTEEDPRLGQQSRGKGLGKREKTVRAGTQKQEAGEGSRSVLEDDLLAMRTLVMGDVAPDVDPADPVLSAFLILPSAGPTTSSGTSYGLQKGWVWPAGSLIDQDIQGLLKDPGLWEFHLAKSCCRPSSELRQAERLQCVLHCQVSRAALSLDHHLRGDCTVPGSSRNGKKPVKRADRSACPQQVYILREDGDTGLQSGDDMLCKQIGDFSTRS